ncbi:MAG: DUF4062 domain-containing protein, partial [Gemmatimonadales bacterium]
MFPLQTGRTIRVFVSSTFGDLKEERNKLHEAVFPRLREFCQARGARFQAIDLRWGVSEEASLDQQTMDICLGEIERCRDVTPRPNFVVLLGQRYGWCPAPPRIPADEFQQILEQLTNAGDVQLVEQWYRRDDNAIPPEYRLLPRQRGSEYEAYSGWKPVETRLHAILAEAVEGLGLPDDRRRPYVASATEQEVAAGALGTPEPEGKVFCFFRSINGATDRKRKVFDGATRFIDADQAPLDALKAELSHLLPSGVKSYEARWSKKENRPAGDHLDRLAEDVYDALAGAIETELTEASGTDLDDVLDGEGRAHCDFANRLLRFFVGRADALRAIRDHLERKGRRSLAVVAAGGAGKSAVMAKAVEEARNDYPGAQVVHRFIGATPRSTDPRMLLEGLCRELSRRYADEVEVPSSYRELASEFVRRLGLASAERPLFVFLDALDQISKAGRVATFEWLPDTLPEHVQLVVSTRPGESVDSTKSEQFERLELGPFPRKEGEELVGLWLADAKRTLMPAQREEVLTKFDESDGR